MEKSKKILKQTAALKAKIESYESLHSKYEDIYTIIEMGSEEEDEELLSEAKELKEEFIEGYDKLKISTLLDGEYDKENAMVTLHAGEGGTEACDWVSMLFRMYTRWAEKKGFDVETLDYLEGDEAGIKSVTFQVTGENAYGYLKSEKGVHRLVRVSPFDSAGRRHTSFASCDVMPEIEEDLEVEIADEDIRVDTYRASGAGGQHINKTESAIRILHRPSGIVVECQEERSQFKNRDKAMKLLRARLYDREKSKRDSEIADERRRQVGTGDRSERIRTYNFPQGRVTDHRIGLTLYTLDSFMNGKMDTVLDALLAEDAARRLSGRET